MNYGQFCPISKAAEILGERWTVLIIRELLMGARRFCDLQRGLGDVSPALLAARLRSFESSGLIVRRRVNGLRGFEYHPTPACEALMPVMLALGEWGQCWGRETVPADIDVELLMLYLERSIDPGQLPGDRTVIQFKFVDLKQQRDWWLLVEGETVDICITTPRRDVDVYITTSLRTMHDVWMGERSYLDALHAGDLIIEGDVALTRHFSSWLRLSTFAKMPAEPVQ